MDDGGCLSTIILSTINSGAQTNGSIGMNPLWVDIVIILLFIFINGFFAGTEMAIINLSDSRIQKEAEEGNKVANKLLYFIENKGNFLATIQLGVTLAGFLSSAFAGDKLAGRLSAVIDPLGTKPYVQNLSLILITVLIAFISLVFGELVPKQIAISYPEQFSRYVVGITRFFDVIFRPFTKFLNFVTRLVLKLFRIDPNATTQAVSEEEIRMLLMEGRDSGSIHANESLMIENIFEFDDKEVSEIMTHRTNVCALNVDSEYEEVVDTAINERYSRIPVYEENIDNIVGVFHIKDLLLYSAGGHEEAFNLRSLLRPPYLTPETKHVDELFREMQNANIALAVVIDEYGGTSGIVTIEDLLEEIVGNIQDEYDDEQREVIRVADNVYMVEGLTSLDDLSRHIPEFKLDEEDEQGDYDTIAGLVLDILGRIPEEFEHPMAAYKNFLFQVMAMDDNRIARLKMTILPVDVNEGDERSKERDKDRDR
ncbi:MAG: hemolysin family protein [Fastidiosipilaceae bacterium]|nr:HlyC/CorC family transporter [Clostridiaceae bacterium]